MPLKGFKIFGNNFSQETKKLKKRSTYIRIIQSLANAPSGWYYNYSDCGDKRSENGDVYLAWFAVKTGNKEFYETERFLRPAAEMGKLTRLAGISLAWLAQYEEKGDIKIPTAWKGEGANPIAIFKSDDSDSHKFYFGGKGGKGTNNHGNMDAGSFVFELNGVRWVVDPGNQSYNTLEITGFDLWGNCQDCERWTLLTKNNFGHSTITVNNKLFVNNGFAPLTNFKSGNYPEVNFDLTAVYGENLKSAKRRFLKDSPTSLVIEDNIEVSDKTELITWQLMTTADVEIIDGGAILKQDGKELKLENLSHPDLDISIVSLYPAPLKLDRQIEGLKRLEIRIPAWTLEGNKTKIEVRLSGN